MSPKTSSADISSRTAKTGRPASISALKLAKVKPKSMLRGYTRSFESSPIDRDSRPYRDINARGPAYKGESYVPPKSS